MNLPTLYKQTSTGKIQEWKISVYETESGPARIEAIYGQTDGKKQMAEEWITEGKNVGRSNETTPFEQACAEAKSQWEKKVKKGYVQSIEDAKAGNIDASMIKGGIDPMLAHKYAEQSHKILWPAYVQPKLDGHRCIAVIQDGVCTLWSRTRKPINSMPHIQDELQRSFPDQNVILDGELYNHDYREKFEELTSKIRQSKPVPGHEVVQYWVYDIVTEDSFAMRHDLLMETEGRLVYKAAQSVVVLPTAFVMDEARMVELFGQWVEMGYEGAMVRNTAGRYKNGRSYDLQKVKLFQDAEFEIVDVVPGKGKMSDKGVFVCKTDNGKEFKAKMIGNLDELRKYLDNKSDYIGRMLTVKFQKFSAEGVPVFGVAMRVREDV